MRYTHKKSKTKTIFTLTDLEQIDKHNTPENENDYSHPHSHSHPHPHPPPTPSQTKHFISYLTESPEQDLIHEIIATPHDEILWKQTHLLGCQSGVTCWKDTPIFALRNSLIRYCWKFLMPLSLEYEQNKKRMKKKMNMNMNMKGGRKKISDGKKRMFKDEGQVKDPAGCPSPAPMTAATPANTMPSSNTLLDSNLVATLVTPCKEDADAGVYDDGGDDDDDDYSIMDECSIINHGGTNETSKVSESSTSMAKKDGGKTIHPDTGIEKEVEARSSSSSSIARSLSPIPITTTATGAATANTTSSLGSKLLQATFVTPCKHDKDEDNDEVVAMMIEEGSTATDPNETMSTTITTASESRATPTSRSSTRSLSPSSSQQVRFHTSVASLDSPAELEDDSSIATSFYTGSIGNGEMQDSQYVHPRLGSANTGVGVSIIHALEDGMSTKRSQSESTSKQQGTAATSSTRTVSPVPVVPSRKSTTHTQTIWKTTRSGLNRRVTASTATASIRSRPRSRSRSQPRRKRQAPTRLIMEHGNDKVKSKSRTKANTRFKSQFKEAKAKVLQKKTLQPKGPLRKFDMPKFDSTDKTLPRGWRLRVTPRGPNTHHVHRTWYTKKEFILKTRVEVAVFLGLLEDYRRDEGGRRGADDEFVAWSAFREWRDSSDWMKRRMRYAGVKK